MDFDNQPADTLIQCDWSSASGIHCRNFALPGSDYCMKHQKLDDKGSTTDYSSAMQRTLPEQLLRELASLRNLYLREDPNDETTNNFPKKITTDLNNLFKNIFSENGKTVIERFRKSVDEDLFDPDTWRGAFYMLSYTYEYQMDFIKRRIKGDYETDDYGMDWEFLNSISPLFEFLYNKYWRIQTSGLENVPEEGRAILVANHSGQVPWDTVMLATSIKLENPSERMVRTFYDPEFSKIPLFSEFFNSIGQITSTENDAINLLEQDELIAFFPEGYQGISKLFIDRYNLARFKRLEFIKAAILTNTPIIPVSIVGAEEAYITLAHSKFLAKLLDLPYFSVTPSWPFLGLLGTIPIPTKWYIDFYQPILLNNYGQDSYQDLSLINHLAEYIRQVIQDMVWDRIRKRESIILG